MDLTAKTTAKLTHELVGHNQASSMLSVTAVLVSSQPYTYDMT